MFQPGDYIMYSNYGACFIDEIKEKTTDAVKRTYYILHPINDVNSKIMTPIDNKKVRIRPIMTPLDAEDILFTISNSTAERISDRKQREQEYSQKIKEGNPIHLAEIINALILEENEKLEEGKKFSATDKKYLEKAERLLYSELSVCLKKDMEQIKENVTAMFK